MDELSKRSEFMFEEALTPMAENFESWNITRDGIRFNFGMTGKVDTGDAQAGSSKYGYGFFDEIFKGKRIVGHGGDFLGVNTRFEMYLDSGYTVIVLSNYDHPAAQRVSAKLREMITQE